LLGKCQSLQRNRIGLTGRSEKVLQKVLIKRKTLLAKAVCQVTAMSLTDCIREQARSHILIRLVSDAEGADQLFELYHLG
jgi:hypothetical protein